MNGFATQDYKAIELVVGQIRTINTQLKIAASSQGSGGGRRIARRSTKELIQGRGCG